MIKKVVTQISIASLGILALGAASSALAFSLIIPSSKSFVENIVVTNAVINHNSSNELGNQDYNPSFTYQAFDKSGQCWTQGINVAGQPGSTVSIRAQVKDTAAAPLLACKTKLTKLVFTPQANTNTPSVNAYGKTPITVDLSSITFTPVNSNVDIHLTQATQPQFTKGGSLETAGTVKATIGTPYVN